MLHGKGQSITDYENLVMPTEMVGFRDLIHTCEHESIHSAIARMMPDESGRKDWNVEGEEGVVLYVEGWSDVPVDECRQFNVHFTTNTFVNVSGMSNIDRLMVAIGGSSIREAMMALDVPREGNMDRLSAWMNWASMDLLPDKWPRDTVVYP